MSSVHPHLFLIHLITTWLHPPLAAGSLLYPHSDYSTCQLWETLSEESFGLCVLHACLDISFFLLCSPAMPCSTCPFVCSPCISLTPWVSSLDLAVTLPLPTVLFVTICEIQTLCVLTPHCIIHNRDNRLLPGLSQNKKGKIIKS